MSDPDTIYHWRRYNAQITTSGQPNECELSQVRDLGVLQVINLGLHEHERALPDEAASVAALGMTYTHIPVAFDAPKNEDFLAFCKALEPLQDEPIHVHCIANLRVTAFLYRYAKETGKLSPQLATSVMGSVWRPGGVWAAFIGDEASIDLEHRPPENRG